MGILSRCVAIVAIALVSGNFACAAAPSGAPSKPSAAELVQGIIDQESKLDAVRSIYLRFEGKWTRPADAIARSIAEFKRVHPNEEADTARNSNFWPEMTEELELAFDQKRVRKLAHWHKFSYDLRVFDGQRAIAHSKYFTYAHEYYALDKSPQRFFEQPFGDLSWLRMGPHQFWFWKDQLTAAQEAHLRGVPEDYALVNEAEFRGRRCFVLENRIARRRLYLGIDDRRLHGLIEMFVPNGVDYLLVASKAAGREFTSEADLRSWIEGLTTEENAKFVAREERELSAFMRPFTEHFMDDYREIALGLWCPGIQGYTSWKGTLQESHIDVQRELHLVEAKINEPLADSLFTIELKDGIQVNDWGHDPPLFYKQKADRSPEEWKAIIDEHEKQNDESKKANSARDALVGQPAPQLPESTWLNSKPLSLASLKGKIILLDFWATGCGPCRNDMPALEAIHKNSKESGIVVIGVHNAGGEAEEVEKFAKERGLSYPIVIDLPPPKEHFAGGMLSSQMSVDGIPYSFVIDPEGRVAAHGSLNVVLAKAYELAEKAKK